ncbi:MAG: AAA family ATPase [Chloroflexota bacterium]|nr:AAA family ATPase [Chloroflexota bacterium]
MRCPRCGKENPEGARFCLQCGTGLAEFRSEQREERKVVSVLFADLVGFTSQAERLDPEEVRAVLQPYHASVRADLERYGGTVEKFIGDAVVALFGAPVAHEDDPERAVRAALAIRDTLRDGPLHVRIGITTGEALIALEARPESGEGMAAGDVVNTAARLQGSAPVDGILVDRSTYRATSRAVEYREHPAVVVKGKTEPIQVWEATSARARFGVDVRQAGQAALVGRVRELEMLGNALARARTEREPQLVTLVGVPGIGKSRIVWELFQQIDAGTDLVAWRQGRSLPYAEGISFWALGEIVKAEAGILDTDSADETAAKLARTVNAAVDESADTGWIERHLRPLVGLEVAEELRGDRRGEAFAAWRRFLEALADRRPLVLVFEDLHWADDGLLDFVDHLVDWATGVPLLVVATARPELLSRRPGWGGGKQNASTISLSPLSDAETQSLVGALVERALLPVSMRESVLERAQGNPLYAEEFARLVSERGSLDNLPESVQGIIAARLDSLSRDEKELLQDAAVVGKVFWGGALAHMGGPGRSAVDDLLHGLERKEFVRRERRSSLAGETEYAFRHILVRDVAYGQIPRGERGERHAMAASWIESLGRPADHAELLAQHYLSAIELARAAGRPTDSYAHQARGALREAGDRAAGLNAFAPAARYYRAALDLTSADDAGRPLLLFRCGRALRVSEESGSEILAEAEAALRAAGDLETAAEAAVLQGELAWFAGDGENTALHLTRAAGLVGDLPASASKAFVLSDLSRFHMLAGRNEQAIAIGREALEIAEALGLDEVRAHALNNIGSARFFLGDVEGVADLEAALEIATAINSPEAARVMNNLAGCLDTLGETKRAAQLWRAGLAWARDLGNVSVGRFIAGAIPTMDYGDGAWDEAIRQLDQFIVDAEEAGGHAQEPICRIFRGRIRFARDDVAGALDDAERAVAAGRRMGDPQSIVPALGFMTWLLVELGRTNEATEALDELFEYRDLTGNYGPDLALAMLELGRGDVDRLVVATPVGKWRDLFTLLAASRLADAASVADEIGLRPTAALLRLHAAENFIVEGRPGEGRPHLIVALEFWRSVGATRYIREAEALSARLDAAEPRPERTARR